MVVFRVDTYISFRCGSRSSLPAASTFRKSHAFTPAMVSKLGFVARCAEKSRKILTGDFPRSGACEHGWAGSPRTSHVGFSAFTMQQHVQQVGFLISCLCDLGG